MARLTALPVSQADKVSKAGNTTFKIDGKLYREVHTNCHKDSCKVCQSGVGHLQYQRYVGDGHWVYAGTKRPASDPDHKPTKCERQGCTNTIPDSAHGKQAFCSNACKQAAYRENKQAANKS